jgi:hypothetical protein
VFQDKDAALLASKQPAYLQEEERSRASFFFKFLRVPTFICLKKTPTYWLKKDPAL